MAPRCDGLKEGNHQPMVSSFAGVGLALLAEGGGVAWPAVVYQTEDQAVGEGQHQSDLERVK